MNHAEIYQLNHRIIGIRNNTLCHRNIDFLRKQSEQSPQLSGFLVILNLIICNT